MKHLREIVNEEKTMGMLVQLTSIFESIASIRIAQIRSQVLQSQQFFEELWHIYTQIRVDTSFNFGRSQSSQKVIDRELFIVITSEGSFSGDIDQKLINEVLQNYDKTKQDIVVIGHHGAMQLTHAGVHFEKYYKLPTRDRDINVLPIVQEVQRYRSSWVYYQTYTSLMVQEVKRIELSKAVQEQGKNVKAADEVISEANYIFEPSAFAVADHLERSMLHIALSQVILESKLAQYASRFRAMSEAHTKARNSRSDLLLLVNRTRRAIKDERLKEIMNGLRKAHVS